MFPKDSLKKVKDSTSHGLGDKEPYPYYENDPGGARDADIAPEGATNNAEWCHCEMNSDPMCDAT